MAVTVGTVTHVDPDGVYVTIDARAAGYEVGPLRWTGTVAPTPGAAVVIADVDGAYGDMVVLGTLA